jgi:hypothetical protein
VKAKEIEFIYLETSQNSADMFTKSLLRLTNEFCKEKVGTHSFTPLKHELVESSTKGDITQAVVCLNSNFSLIGFVLRASDEKKSLERQNELSALLALFHKSRTTRKCSLEIWESWLSLCSSVHWT